MSRSPELGEDVMHSSNPEKSVMAQAQDGGKSFSPLTPKLAFPVFRLWISSTGI